jgi:hypothetical protein
MAQFFPYFVNIKVADQIKTLPTEELLDFWEETQFMEDYLEKGTESVAVYSLEYERAVLQELQIRSCMGRLDAR